MRTWISAEPASAYKPNTAPYRAGKVFYLQASPNLQVAGVHSPQWGAVHAFLVLRPCCGAERYLTSFTDGGVSCNRCFSHLPYAVEWDHALYLDGRRRDEDIRLFEAWCGVGRNVLDAALLAHELRDALVLRAEVLPC